MAQQALQQPTTQPPVVAQPGIGRDILVAVISSVASAVVVYFVMKAVTSDDK